MVGNKNTAKDLFGIGKLDRKRLGQVVRDAKGSISVSDTAKILNVASTNAAKHGGRNPRIFGSVAKGEAGFESDIDLLIKMEEGRSLLDLRSLVQDLRDLLGIKVDVVSGDILLIKYCSRFSRCLFPGKPESFAAGRRLEAY